MTLDEVPRSAGELTKRVRVYARKREVAEGRVRLWIADMALAGALGVARDEGAAPLITVKGGVAMELRLPKRARATRDVDLSVHAVDVDLVEVVEAALASGWGDFTLRRSGEPHVMLNGTVRLRVAVQYRGSAWATLQVDVSHTDLEDVGSEDAAPLSLQPFGLQGPPAVPCLPVTHQIAQKLHAVTEPTTLEVRQERVRHLVDLLLIRELATDLSALRTACRRVFAARATHSWPPSVVMVRGWEPEFARLAVEVGLEAKDLEGAIRQLDAFIQQVEAAE